MRKKKFTRVETFKKRPIYFHLLMKYNYVCNKYNALIDTIESDLYKEIIDGAYSKAMTMEHYKNENIKLRKKIKELNKLLPNK